MAESTLSIAYADIQVHVGRFLGYNRTVASWDANQNTDFADIIDLCARQFYFPPTQDPTQPYYEWSFLRKLGTITLVTDTSSYDLPDDCSGTVHPQSFTYASTIVQRRLKIISEQDIRTLQAVKNKTGYPKYGAIRNKAHAPTTGQRFEVIVYPTPDATANTKVVTFSYIFVPNLIDATNKYPVGGALYSHVILQSALSAAEQIIDDDPQGPQTAKFRELLEVAIRDDRNKKRAGSDDRGTKV